MKLNQFTWWQGGRWVGRGGTGGREALEEAVLKRLNLVSTGAGGLGERNDLNNYVRGRHDGVAVQALTWESFFKLSLCQVP